MKILFLAPADNYHTQKWCGYFLSKGYDVEVISFFPGEISGATVHFIDCSLNWQQSDGRKLKYLLQASKVRSLAESIAPDIISVHYATSYGTVAALAGLKNYALSVWGGDIYTFPHKSPFHHLLLQYSLKKAPHLLSTSAAMGAEMEKYIDKSFSVTPFGVKTDLFSPAKRTRPDCDGRFVVGTVKALKPKYGIDVLLNAAAAVKKDFPEIPLEVRIAGSGPLEAQCRTLADDLGISGIVTWLGFISQEDAAAEWANMDVAVVPSVSDSESFGVSAVEAEACGVPVITSDVPGLMEATAPGKTSIAVPRRDSGALAAAIAELYNNPGRRKEMGLAGRQFAEENYEYNMCFEKIEEILLAIAAEKH